MYENGAYYLFVDGQCNYWVSNPSEVWDATRSGVLDVESAAELGKRLHFDAWPELHGTWADPTGGVFDAPVLVFDDAGSAVVCAELCNASDVPSAVKAMRDASPQVAQELWDAGTPIESPVRAIAVVGEFAAQIPYVDWPLARPISDFVRTDDHIGFGLGTLEDNVASVQALKELRASFLRGDHGVFFWNQLPIKSNGSYYSLYLRDTLPFEDAQGLVALTAYGIESSP
jgi:hypothetical protein